VPSSSAPIYRFGVFEFDAQTAELRKSGVKLRLQDQPCQVLLKLLENPGEMVSREQLQSALWHEDTFVEFETALNTVVKRLRETLSDSADNPTFIETLPRRGYRFIAPVEVLAGKNGETRTAARAKETPRKRAFGIRNWIIAGLAVLCVIGVVLWRSQPRPPTVANAIRITNDEKAKNALNLPVTDGVHLYFIEGAPWTSGSGIAQMSATGGETTHITTTLPDPLAIYAISPDRSKLLVASGVAASTDAATGRTEGSSEVWVQPLPAGVPYRVGNIYASAACWTPDGTQIVYSDGGAILLANKDGGEARELAKVPGVVRGLRFSPDGQRIRFYVMQPPGFDSSSVWEMDGNGKNVHVLFAEWKQSPFQCCGNWSPDGDYYYFQAGRGSEQALWVRPERRFFFGRSEANPGRLMSGPLRFSSPVPSGDGKKIFAIGEEPRVEALRYDEKAHRFDSFLEGLSAGGFDFSQDRKWIVYVTYPDMALWRSRVDGSEKMQLTFPPMRAFQPRWSPDGFKVAFLDVQFYHPWRIRLISSSGGSAEILMQTSDNEVQADPTWMPDGKSIVFGKSQGTHKAGIYQLDLGSGGVTSIPDSDGLFSPRVSPDGRSILAFASGQAKLMLFDIGTKKWSTLAEGEDLNYNEWTHDGKFVYMRETQAGAAELVRVRVKDGRVERVVSLKDVPQVVDILAGWIGLTPEDAPVMIRDRSVQEIYALELQFH